MDILNKKPCDHKFEARYDEMTEPDIEGIKEIMSKINETNYYEQNISGLNITNKIYMGDICIHCGEFIRFDHIEKDK